MLFLYLSLNQVYLSHLTKVSDEERSPGWVMAAVYVVSMIYRAMCSKSINITGLNSCLNFNRVYGPYAQVRTRLSLTKI